MPEELEERSTILSILYQPSNRNHQLPKPNRGINYALYRYFLVMLLEEE